MDSALIKPRSLRLIRQLVTAFAASLVVGWTSVGESSDPVLAVDELPLELLAQCASASPGSTDCQPGETLVSHWVGRSARGDLFLTSQSDCIDQSCRAWVFERGRQHVSLLLALEGQVNARPGGDYPLIESRALLATGETVLSHYRWSGQAYERADAEMHYRVDGVECGTAEQCQGVAHDALEGDRIDRAVRIYERVQGISWI